MRSIRYSSWFASLRRWLSTTTSGSVEKFSPITFPSSGFTATVETVTRSPSFAGSRSDVLRTRVETSSALMGVSACTTGSLPSAVLRDTDSSFSVWPTPEPAWARG